MGYYVNNICFRGGGETTGSVAHSNSHQVAYPTNRQMAFKADSFEYSDKPNKKKHTGLKILIGTLATAGLVIGGLGCAHKYADKLPNWLSKINDGGFGKATKTCREWCHYATDKGRSAWNWAKGLLKNK